jgi:hypothetical protein
MMKMSKLTMAKLRAISKLPHSPHNIETSATKAYTMFELAIVLTIMGLTAFIFLGIIDSMITVGQYKTTFERLDAVERRMLKYMKTNRGLPCPAAQSTDSNTEGYGEDGNACASSSIDTLCPNATAFQIADTTVGYVGSVPAIALGLTADYMYDGFGRRFTYYVSSKVNCKNGTDINAGFYTEEADLPTVQNKTNSASVLHSYQKNAYVLVSHGRNGYGAYTKAGIKAATDLASNDELENADGDNVFVYNYFRPSAMDDILRFKTKWQLMLDFEDLDYTKRYPSAECTCVSTSVTKFDAMCF